MPKTLFERMSEAAHPMTPHSSQTAISERLLELADEMPGHWDTAEGAAVARQYVNMPRGNLSHGEMSDLALANRMYMAGRGDLDLTAWQHAAKERIRWLSAQLAAALRATEHHHDR